MKYLVVAAVCLVAFSGCLAGESDDEPEVADEGALFGAPAVNGTAPRATPAGIEDVHGEPERTDGPVEAVLSPTNARWRASQEITVTNDFGGASFASYLVDNSAGEIAITATPGDRYEVAVVLEAFGATEMEARATLESLAFVHEDSMDGDTLSLGSVVEYDDESTPIPGLNANLGQRRATVVITVPAGPAFTLAVDTSSADVAIAGIQGSGVSVDTSSGDVSIAGVVAGIVAADSSSGDVTLSDVVANKIVVATSSGDVVVGGAGVDIVLDTSSGSITAAFLPLADGRFVSDSSSGDVVVVVAAGAAYGYDVILDTSSGRLSAEIEDGETHPSDDEDRLHVRTADFDAREIRVDVVASTSSGDISVGH